MCDSNLFDFKAINTNSEVVAGGDIAFDKETFDSQNTALNTVNEQGMVNIINV